MPARMAWAVAKVCLVSVEELEEGSGASIGSGGQWGGGVPMAGHGGTVAGAAVHGSVS
jgi:hypothetical protein